MPGVCVNLWGCKDKYDIDPDIRSSRLSGKCRHIQENLVNTIQRYVRRGAQRKEYCFFQGFWKAFTEVGHLRWVLRDEEKLWRCFRHRGKYVQDLSMTICMLGNGKWLVGQEDGKEGLEWGWRGELDLRCPKTHSELLWVILQKGES